MDEITNEKFSEDIVNDIVCKLLLIEDNIIDVVDIGENPLMADNSRPRKVRRFGYSQGPKIERRLGILLCIKNGCS